MSLGDVGNNSGAVQGPGRRTPLSVVGLGGYYISPSGLQPPLASCSGVRDENSPEPNTPNSSNIAASRYVSIRY